MAGSALTPMGRILDVITQRQLWAVNNIANMHTPGYVAKHASFSDLLGPGANPFETSLAQKLGGGLAPSLMATEDQQGVNVQDEFMDMQKNILFYSIAARRLSSIVTSMRTATQVGR